MALGSGSYDTVGENILPGTYVSLSEDSGEEASKVVKKEVIGVTVMNMKSSSKKYVYSTDYVNKALEKMAESISTEEIKVAAENAVDAYIDTLNPATEEANGLMSADHVIQLKQARNDIDAQDDKISNVQQAVRTNTDDVETLKSVAPTYNNEYIKLVVKDDPDAQDIQSIVDAYLSENPPTSEIDSEQLASAINDYLMANPPEGGLDINAVNAAIEDYLTANPPHAEVDETQVQNAVNSYMLANPVSGLTNTDKALVNSKISQFNTVAEMLANTGLTAGGLCITRGFYSPNDGGGAVYILTKEYTVDGYIVLQTAVSGLHAVLNERGTINVKHAGAKGDGSTDDTAAIQAVINTWYVQKIYIPKGTYAVTGLTLTSSTRVIEGDGYWLSTIKCIAKKDCDVLYLDNHGAYMGTIRQLRIQGNASYKQNGLNVKPSDAGTSSFTVDYVNIENCKGVGLYIQTYNGRAAYHCNFTNIILQSNGVGADVTLNDGTIANFYCYQSETYGMKIAGFNCRISNGKLAQNSYSHHGSSLGVDATYPAMYLSGARNVLNNLDFQENGGIGLVTADQSRNIMGSNIILDANGSDLLPVGGANGSFSKPWVYIGGFYNSFHFNIANFDNTKPATSIIQSYYSGKTEVYCMDSTGNSMYILPYAKNVRLLPYHDKDHAPTLTSGYTASYVTMYGTKNGLKLTAGNYLTVSPVNFKNNNSFCLMLTFQINFTQSSLTAYQDIFKLGSFYSVYSTGGAIKINGGGSVKFASGDVFRIVCVGVMTKDMTEKVYNILYKYNSSTEKFVQVGTVNLTNASYLTQKAWDLKLGTAVNASDTGLNIVYGDVSFGEGMVYEQVEKYACNPEIHDKCNYYMALDSDLSCGGV